MEAAVRESSAQPATIAILKGRITVGISTDDVESFASRPAGAVRKCSGRDRPVVTGLGADGAITVAGTITRRSNRHRNMHFGAS